MGLCDSVLLLVVSTINGANGIVSGWIISSFPTEISQSESASAVSASGWSVPEAPVVLMVWRVFLEWFLLVFGGLCYGCFVIHSYDLFVHVILPLFHDSHPKLDEMTQRQRLPVYPDYTRSLFFSDFGPLTTDGSKTSVKLWGSV